MIYSIDDLTFKNDESYKERNLYYKIFAGYFFNELILEYKIRKTEFFELLVETISIPGRFFGNKEKAFNMLKKMQNEDLHVTFDFHPTQNRKNDNTNDAFDRGEMSDILILSKTNMLSIECKYLSDVSYQKDVIDVQKRIIKFIKPNNLEPLQIFLLKREKWKKSIPIKAELDKKTDVPAIVISWEDLLLKIKDPKVNGYLREQLKRLNP